MDDETLEEINFCFIVPLKRKSKNNNYFAVNVNIGINKLSFNLNKKKM